MMKGNYHEVKLARFLFINIPILCIISLHTVFDSAAAFNLCTFGRFQIQRRQSISLLQPSKISHFTDGTRLFMSGYGIASNYTWKEDAYEIDITVSVPTNTRAKDVVFKATSRSIDLRLVTTNISAAPFFKNTADEIMEPPLQTELVLLDGTRKLRGRINTDGTYWVISDASSDSGNPSTESRQITVTIEKIIAIPKDDFDIVDYDWMGIYHVEDNNEILERKYDKPEPLDVRQYAAEMGVDIDNLNMSMVDKNMFNSGLNLTKSTLQSLHKSGYLSTQEVTQQADGTEYIVNGEGEPERVANTPVIPSPVQQKRHGSIPFIDTDSPWHKVSAAMNETFSNGTSNETIVQLKRNFTRAAFAEDSSKTSTTTKDANPFRNKNIDDPIDALTVVRLKEILKAQGLKTSGAKRELQERLRNKVNALLQGNDQ